MWQGRQGQGRIKGRIEQNGVRVQEIYTIELEPDEHEAFRTDPEGHMRRFLEQEGFTVNGVHFDIGRGTGGGSDGQGEMRPGGTWVHEVWPYKSDWHCCY